MAAVILAFFALAAVALIGTPILFGNFVVWFLGGRPL